MLEIKAKPGVTLQVYHMLEALDFFFFFLPDDIRETPLMQAKFPAVMRLPLLYVINILYIIKFVLISQVHFVSWKHQRKFNQENSNTSFSIHYFCPITVYGCLYNDSAHEPVLLLSGANCQCSPPLSPTTTTSWVPVGSASAILFWQRSERVFKIWIVDGEGVYARDAISCQLMSLSFMDSNICYLSSLLPETNWLKYGRC